MSNFCFISCLCPWKETCVWGEGYKRALFGLFPLFFTGNFFTLKICRFFSVILQKGGQNSIC